jgi:HPt (histidine-containing phosphotransfer) domain-containing protein
MDHDVSEPTGKRGSEGDLRVPGDDHVDEGILSEVLQLLDDEAPDALLKACELFRQGAADRIAEIDAGLADGRPEAVTRAAHSLRGSAGAFGARRLNRMVERLETVCSEGEISSAPALVDEIRTEFDVFRVILDARLASFSV